MVTMLTMLVLALACASVGASEPQYPAPAPSPEASQFGAGIQRTMTLLATSTPEHRNRVRILFYGQSITEQSWSVAVADYLRSHFPYADLEIENCAIGGFLAEFLEKDAETDLYPRYPDLMIFDDYGDTAALARIIANTRRRTTSEILLQNYHLRRPEDAEADRGEDAASYGFLPALAAEYGCELVDQRTPWRQYLKDNGLAPQALLDNTVHLNAEGNYLMAKLVEEHLRCRPELPNDTWHDLVRTHPLNGDLGWHDRRLALEFDGNRVDLIAAPGAGEEERARVLIDGAPPSANPALYAFTRASLAPGVWWPAVIGVTSSAPLLVEDWTLRVFDASDDMKHFRFAVTGSKTGPDGEGTSEARFVSRSGPDRRRAVGLGAARLRPGVLEAARAAGLRDQVERGPALPGRVPRARVCDHRVGDGDDGRAGTEQRPSPARTGSGGGRPRRHGPDAGDPGDPGVPTASEVARRYERQRAGADREVRSGRLRDERVGRGAGVK